jgi:hypothetical protein
MSACCLVKTHTHEFCVVLERERRARFPYDAASASPSRVDARLMKDA